MEMFANSCPNIGSKNNKILKNTDAKKDTTYTFLINKISENYMAGIFMISRWILTVSHAQPRGFVDRFVQNAVKNKNMLYIALIAENLPALKSPAFILTSYQSNSTTVEASFAISVERPLTYSAHSPLEIGDAISIYAKFAILICLRLMNSSLLQCPKM